MSYIRRELYHLYEQVLSKTKTARINMVRVLFLFLTRFHVNVARSNGNPTFVLEICYCSLLA